jgi:hypothetical protein
MRSTRPSRRGEARDQIAALPDDALAGYAEALGALVSYWQAETYVR